MPKNQLKLHTVAGSSEYGTYRELQVFIDGRNLIDILTEYEMPFAKAEGHSDLAGAYSGLPDIECTESRFLGQSDLEYGIQEDKVAMLDCTCGHPGCWTWAVRIAVTEKEVIWSDFEQVHRGSDSSTVVWDYTKLGPFRFDKDAYVAEVLRNTEPAGSSDDARSAAPSPER